jgi:hypothetical protein
VVEVHLGDGRPGAADVPGRGVHQEVLAGGVVAPLLGDGRPGDEGVPGHLVHVRRIGPAGVAAGDGDVVAGVGHQGVDQQAAGDGGVDVLLDPCQDGARGPGVPPGRADVGLENGKRQTHVG